MSRAPLSHHDWVLGASDKLVALSSAAPVCQGLIHVRTFEQRGLKLKRQKLLSSRLQLALKPQTTFQKEF